VEWAASQPWSTGTVDLYGKSYDAVTGLMGIARQPHGLAAVVAQEPVDDLYRCLYSPLASRPAKKRAVRSAGERMFGW
jgi:predicted acyl esterase